MDTTPSDVGMPGSETFIPGVPRTEVLLEALKSAIANRGEHRLFRSGKLAGLFPSRAGVSSEAALLAIREGMLETIRTETRGRIVTEWVRATPKAVSFVHDHDSPKSVLRELKERPRSNAIRRASMDGRSQTGTRGARDTLPGTRRSRCSPALMTLAARVESALRRAELYFPTLAEPVGRDGALGSRCARIPRSAVRHRRNRRLSAAGIVPRGASQILRT